MKISAFHLMPHRELPADFEKRYESVWVTPPWWELADPRPRGPVLQLDARRAALRRARRASTACAPTSITRTPTASCPAPTSWARARQGHQRPARGHRADGRHPADAEPAHPRRRGVRDARLHQRRAAGGGPAAGQPHGREPLLRHHAHGASRALPRGLRPDAEGLAGARDLRVERPLLPAGQREPLAPPHPAAASAGVGAGLGQHQHLRFRRRERGLLLLPELFGRPVGQGHDGRLLGRGAPRRAATPIPYRAGFLQLVAVAGDGRQARKSDYARHVEYFYHKCLHVPPGVVLAAGQSGLPEPRGHRAQLPCALP